MNTAIQIGIDAVALKQLAEELRELKKQPVRYEGFFGMFVDAWLTNKIAMHLREGTTVRGLTVQNCNFYSREKE